MNPYQSLPRECFWRTGVAEEHPLSIKRLYTKKFEIAKTAQIATGGSCFAQHVSSRLRREGYCLLDFEPPPPGLSEADAKTFGYRTYSARFGNIYTARQLLQLLLDAKRREVRDEDIWEKDGAWYDGLRPGVEPNGLDSADHVREHRAKHLRFVLRLFQTTDLFIFTLGLTEAWLHRKSGTVYPMCPGTLAGDFDEFIHKFHNFGFTEILGDLHQARAILKSFNPKMQFIFTVSPVPLTATATGRHVLDATTYSKSTLRSVCGAMVEEFDDVDYFPSYELIASPFSRGFFFEPNMRSVTEGGVDAVMRVFFSEHSTGAAKVEGETPSTKRKAMPKASAEDVICEEKLLEAFQT